MRRRRRMIVIVVVAMSVLAGTPSHGAGPLAPANDDFADAVTIGALPFEDSRDPTMATSEEGEPQCNGSSPKSIWYVFTPEADVDVRINATPGSSPYTSLALFTGDDVAHLTRVDDCRGLSGITATLSAGVAYHLRIATNLEDSGGKLGLTVSALAAIAGRITGEDGEPLRECAIAYGTDGEWGGYTQAEADGRYAIRVLHPGTYNVHFGWCGPHVPEWYDDVATQEEAQGIQVAAGERATGIDGVLVRGATASGRLTDNAGNVLPNECVYGYGSDADPLAFAATGADGRYTLSFDQSGSYRIRFGCDYGPRTPEWYEDAAERSDATPVAVTLREDTPGIDAVLALRPLPPNDSLADATTITALPFVDRTDAFHATEEADEPLPCSQTVYKTLWYRFAPTEDQVVALQARSEEYPPIVAVYEEDAQGLHPLTCTRDATRGRGAAGFLARSGKTYAIQVSTPYGVAGRVSLVADVTSGGDIAPVTAVTPCGAACPYWTSLNSEAKNENACAQQPQSVPGSWTDVPVEVPAAAPTGTPVQLVAHTAPAVDLDMWLCLVEPGPTGKRYVAHAANLSSDNCPVGPIRCEESLSIPVEPGERFILRVYNWADPAPAPVSWSFRVE